MVADMRAQRGAKKSHPHWQFSLRAALCLTFIVSIVLAIASQFPRQAAFTVSMTLLLLIPLVVHAVVRAPFIYLGILPKQQSWQGRPVANLLLCPFGSLGPGQGDNDPSLVAGITTATLSTGVLVGLWPLVREIGIVLSLLSRQPIENYTYTCADAVGSAAEVFLSAD